MTVSSPLIKPFRFPWLRQALFWALLLSILFAGMRVAGTLGGKLWQPLLPLGFVLMMGVPWLLLTADGRQRIGLARAGSAKWYGVAVVAGIAASSFCHVLGVVLFDRSADNWFVSIANNYRGIMPTAGMDALQLHLIFTVPALLFSPIGEEIFFRGFLQQALQEKLSVTASTMMEAGLFGVVHLCHHGLFLTAAGIGLHAGSGALWVVLMFATALMLAWLRRVSSSLYPAMLGHAAFNATMNVWIFSMLWN
ncbi:MAG: CPBP family intramembrane metalloprotease [Betaproteobacteria bacterium]|nr:CPBP family intramembrane metalloprotease [Betaproteobacteria bacterium]